MGAENAGRRGNGTATEAQADVMEGDAEKMPKLEADPIDAVLVAGICLRTAAAEEAGSPAEPGGEVARISTRKCAINAEARHR